MNRRLLTAIAAMLMMAIGTTTVWGQCTITVVADPTAGYTPTQIANGNFSTQPHMEGYGSNRIPNGTNQGWNTTESGNNCFEYLCAENWIPYVLTANNNCIVEMNADNESALYQDLFTNGGDVIRWSLKHAVRYDPINSPKTQAIRVEVGAPNYNGANIVYPHGINNDINTEINANTKASYIKGGITNPSAGTYGYAGQLPDLDGLSLDRDTNRNAWYSATGVYVIPEGQGVTRFAFVSYGANNGECASCGNFLDDITFSTLIGNMTATYDANNSVIISGYWGDTDPNKKLVVNVGNQTFNVTMNEVTGHNFTVTIPGSCIGINVSGITFYHEDYPSAARTIVATHPISATANPTAGGSITGAGSYTHNAACTLTAMPSTGYHFVNWTEGGDVVSTNASYTFTVTSTRTLTANFQLNSYTIAATANPTAGGTVAGAGNYNHFASCTLTATPAADYHFVKWQDDNNDNPRTFTVTEGATYTATFAIDEYRIDSIRRTWRVKIGNEEPIEPTPYVTNPTATDTMGYVMIPVGAEFVIIPSDVQKPLVSKLELIDKTPLTFEAMTANTVISFTAAAGAILEYSLNGGAWTAYSSPITLTEIGDKVSFHGDNTAMASSPSEVNCSSFSCTTGSAYVYGNVMSLLSKTEYPTATSVPAYAFCRLFSGCANIYNHETKELVLPATTLGDYCYAHMFNACSNLTSGPILPAMTMAIDCYSNMFFGCTGLTTAPALPATSLAYACYQFMFKDCISLESAPNLPATTLAGYCYASMFEGCTGLISAPVLSATTLADLCCYWMFKNCTNLTTAPALPAATLTAGCYYGMFYGCSNLNNLTCRATNMTALSCTENWLYGVAATGRFYKATSAVWTNGVSAVPNGWSVVHTTFGGFNSETTAHPILEISSDLGGTSIITRNDGVVDLQDHTIFILYCQNNTSGDTLTIQNGTLSGGIDGNGGWNDNYYGTVRLVNMTINDVFNDGHAFVIESGTYTNVRNTAKDGASPAYPGTYTIYGGYFNAFGSDLASGHHYGTYTLYGGRYKFNPSQVTNVTVTIPSGYHLVDDGSGEYRWHVEPDNVP